ncbi:hypothetical protein [Flavobacterium sp.]|uniref:hypothetical protein n=1 Tax=Flavobacterium sp. TaxID=239 RepID=UPI003D6BD320
MENNSAIEKLIERAEAYAKTSLELYKYNAIDKSADIFSTLAVRLAITVVLIMFSLMINIGLALWIGEILGKAYYGFFVIAVFYLLLALLLYIFRKQWIKNPVSNFIIVKTLKED